MEVAREAGALIAAYYERRIGFELKGEYDLVTEADRNSEKLIVSRLRACYPDHDIVAEEGGGHLSGAEYRWYVDPLDGTTNFAHGFPVFAVAPAAVGFDDAGDLDAVVAFVLQPLDALVLHRGTWHWGPFPLGPEAVHLFNVQGLRYRDDNACMDLAAAGLGGVEVRVPVR